MASSAHIVVVVLSMAVMLCQCHRKYVSNQVDMKMVDPKFQEGAGHLEEQWNFKPTEGGLPSLVQLSGLQRTTTAFDLAMNTSLAFSSGLPPTVGLGVRPGLPSIVGLGVRPGLPSTVGLGVQPRATMNQWTPLLRKPRRAEVGIHDSRHSRRSLLLHAVAAAAATGTLPAIAALPSISEYSDVQYKIAPDANAIASYKDRQYAIGQNVRREDVEIGGMSTSEGFERLLRALGRTQQLVETRSFEDARLVLRAPLFSEFLGFNPGIRGFQSNPQPAAALLKALPDGAAAPLKDALVSLKALDDFLLINRVIFFNAEDKAQVEALAAGGTNSATPGQPTKQVDLDEPKMLLAEVVAAVREASKLVTDK